MCFEKGNVWIKCVREHLDLDRWFKNLFGARKRKRILLNVKINFVFGGWFNVHPCIHCECQTALQQLYSAKCALNELFFTHEHRQPLILLLLLCLVSDVCVFGNESGLPVCSHMLFYPSIASGSGGQPSPLPSPPASLSLFGWPFLSPSLFPSTPPLWLSSFCLFVSLSAQRLSWPLSLSRGRVVSVSFLLFPSHPTLFTQKPCWQETWIRQKSLLQ